MNNRILPPMKPKAIAMWVIGGVVVTVVSLFILSRISAVRSKVGLSSPAPVTPPKPTGA
jgi:hypothetical protein